MEKSTTKPEEDSKCKILETVEKISLKGYADPDRIKDELIVFLSKHTGFQPSRGSFFFRNGRFQEFVNIKGPLAIKQQDGVYEVTVILWLAIHFPHKAPMVEIRPVNRSQSIKIGKLVESDGRVSHPYLQNWKNPDSSMTDFLSVLAEDFLLEPPIYNTSLSFYHMPVNTYTTRTVEARAESRLMSAHKSSMESTDGYVVSDEIESFAMSQNLSEDIMWSLAQHGVQSKKTLRCLRESDLDKLDLPLGEMVQLREAIAKLKGEPPNNPTDPNYLFQNLGKALYRLLQQMSIEDNDLEIQEILGEGNFGRVYKAEIFPNDEEKRRFVAVKTLQEHATQRHLESFLEEIINMRPLNHPNVMTMIGFIQKTHTPYIIMHYMSAGDLKSYVSNHERSFSIEDMLKFGLQISYGMAYLSEQKFIHGDLAARNCMLDENNVVKVGDFGLARHLFLSDYYTSSGDKPCPSLWMATEVLLKSTYTLKSDVWSYGVVLWELFTRGQTPYEGTLPIQVSGLIGKGYRLGRPKTVDKAIYRVMNECWHNDEERRPNFKHICEWLTKMTSSDVYQTEMVPIVTSHIEPVPPRQHKVVSKMPSLMPSNDET